MDTTDATPVEPSSEAIPTPEATESDTQDIAADIANEGFLESVTAQEIEQPKAEQVVADAPVATPMVETAPVPTVSPPSAAPVAEISAAPVTSVPAVTHGAVTPEVVAPELVVAADPVTAPVAEVATAPVVSVPAVTQAPTTMQTVEPAPIELVEPAPVVAAVSPAVVSVPAVSAAQVPEVAAPVVEAVPEVQASIQAEQISTAAVASAKQTVATDVPEKPRQRARATAVMKQQKVHLYKLVITAMIGVVFAAGGFGLYQWKYTYSIKQYAVDNYSNTKVNTEKNLSETEKIQAYRKLVTAAENAQSYALQQHSFDAQNPQWDTWEDQMRKAYDIAVASRTELQTAVRTELGITEKQQKEILAQGATEPTWARSIADPEKALRKEQYFLGLNLYAEGGKENLIKAYPSFVVASLLEYPGGTEMKEKIEPLLTDKQKAIALEDAEFLLANIGNPDATKPTSTAKRYWKPTPVVEQATIPEIDPNAVPSWLKVEVTKQKKSEEEQHAAPPAEVNPLELVDPSRPTYDEKINPRRARETVNKEDLWWYDEGQHQAAPAEDTPWPGESGYNPFKALLLWMFE